MRKRINKKFLLKNIILTSNDEHETWTYTNSLLCII